MNWKKLLATTLLTISPTIACSQDLEQKINDSQTEVRIPYAPHAPKMMTFEYLKKEVLDTIVLDPGHDSLNIGEIRRPSYGLKEHELTLTIAKELQCLLQEQGYVVYLTREDHSPVNKDSIDYSGDKKINLRDELLARSNVATEKNAKIFMSIHINNQPKYKTVDPDTVSGPRLYYFGLSSHYRIRRNSKRQRYRSYYLSDGRVNFFKPETTRIHSKPSKDFAFTLAKYFRKENIDNVEVWGTDLRIVRRDLDNDDEMDRISLLWEVAFYSSPIDIKQIRSDILYYPQTMANIFEQMRYDHIKEKKPATISSK